MGSEMVGSLGSLRELNRTRVIDALRVHGMVSRAEIARRTGLSRSTVSTIVADLQAGGYVIESDDAGTPIGAQGGRPPVLLSLDRSAGAVLGIAFGHDDLRVAVSDLSHTILAEATRSMNVGQSAADGLAAAGRLVDRVLAEAGIDRYEVLGAGLGLPGPIESGSGSVGSQAILPGWAGVDAAQEMSERLGVPVFVENDANLEALAEVSFGAGRDVGDLVYLMVSSGIGAGLVIDGKLHRGSSGTAGEIGHVILDEQGQICRCGNRGCLETFASVPSLLDLLGRTHGDRLTLDDMLALARDGDPAVQRVIADAGRAIGIAVANLVNVINPTRVIVGGDLSAAGDLLLDPLRDSLSRYAIPAAAAAVEVVPSALGERAGVMGALALAIGESGGVLSSRLATTRVEVAG